MRASCEGCRYYRMIHNTNNKKSKCCHYLLDTGFMRESDPENCNKRVERKHKKRESVSMIDGHIDNHVSPKGERTE